MASVLEAPHFHNEESAFEYVEARLWPEGAVCPFCGEREKVGRLQGKTTRPGLRKCYRCRKPFTVRIGTIFEASHLKLHLWLQAIHLMCASKKGISTRQLHRMLGCGLKTAWFLSHRIREAMIENKGVFVTPLGGIEKTVEADETYLGRKSTTKAFKPVAENQAIFALVERDGSVRSFHVANVRASTLHTIINKHAAIDSRFITDEAGVYLGAHARFIHHATVQHSKKEYVCGTIHTNTVEGYFSILKRGIYGVYQHVSEAHLKRYLVEFDFRYSHRAKLGVDDVARADLAIKGARGKRLTYRTTGGRRREEAAEA
jgi:transposase-like protein